VGTSGPETSLNAQSVASIGANRNRLCISLFIALCSIIRKQDDAFVFTLLLVGPSLETLLIMQYPFLFECTLVTIVQFDYLSKYLEMAA